MNLAFTESETEYMLNIVKFYEVTKELLIFGEQIDTENRTLVQTINELRNCLDHIMRVVSFKFGRREPSDGNEYIRINLDKAFGHVYRAAYDTLDWVSLNLKDCVIKELQSFELETIKAVMPEYFTDLKPKLEKIITNDIVRLRAEKDIAITSEDNLVAYGQVTAELKKLVQAISSKKPSFIEYQNRLRQSQRRKLILRIAEDAVVGIVFAIIAGIVVWIFTKPH